MAQLVEHLLAKEEVAGSSPVCRSCMRNEFDSFLFCYNNEGNARIYAVYLATTNKKRERYLCLEREARDHYDKKDRQRTAYF